MSGRREAYAAAVGRLRSAQKPAAVTPAYTRFVNRRIGGWFAAAAHVAGRTPNQVTGLSAAFAAAGIVAVALVRPSPLLAVVVAVLLLVAYALDSADGLLSRLRGGGSLQGEWLDHVVDCAKTIALHSAVLVSVYRFQPDAGEAYLLVPLAWILVSVVFFFAVMLRDQLLQGRPTTDGDVARSTSVRRSVLLLPIDHGVQCLAFLALADPQVFRWLYAALLAVTAIFSVRGLVRTFSALA